MTKKHCEKVEDLHFPVLLAELVWGIEIFTAEQNVIIDCTIWLGWHASHIIEKLNKWDIFVWFDADIENLKLAKQRLEKINTEVEKIYINSNFVNLKQELEKRWINEFTWIYYDLGISSVHIDDESRWFSFMRDWPLDMRFDRTGWSNARYVVNKYSKEKLEEIFREYWEERFSKMIANNIIEYRNKKEITTTGELSEIIWWDIKTKSRIFQAIRIEVNNELKNIEISINDAIRLLKTWWSIFVISFHSLEDRIIKNIFKRESKNCICEDMICSCNHTKSLKILSKKPIIPTWKEIKINTRSRSAKARLAIKI